MEVFRQLPADRLLLETDAPDMMPPAQERGHWLPGDLNHPANLALIGQSVAKRLGMEVMELAALTTRNADRCFGQSR
jgi:TatD DNase family protein